MDKVFKDMLRVDVVRGPHSTGIATVNFNGDVKSVKKVLLPDDLLSLQQTKDMINENNKVLLGHNRWATMGGIDNNSAHPFHLDDLVGAHNGTLKGKWRLPKEYDAKVDSEHLYRTIEGEGVDKAWELTDGAAALTWYDIKTKKLHFLRNNERTFFYAFTEDNKNLLWASEAWMISCCAARHGVKLGKIEATELNTLYSFDPFGEVNKYTTKKLQPFQTYTPPANQSSNNFNKKGGTTKGAEITIETDKFTTGDMVELVVDTLEVKSTQVVVRGHTVLENTNVVIYLPDTIPNFTSLVDRMDNSENSWMTQITGYCIPPIHTRKKGYLLGSPSKIVEVVQEKKEQLVAGDLLELEYIELIDRFNHNYACFNVVGQPEDVIALVPIPTRDSDLFKNIIKADTNGNPIFAEISNGVFTKLGLVEYVKVDGSSFVFGTEGNTDEPEDGEAEYFCEGFGTFTAAQFINASDIDQDCLWCQSPFHKYDKLVYGGRYQGMHNFICERCAEDESVQEMMGL